MTPLLDLLFECVLDPKHKVDVVKKEIKDDLTYAKTGLDVVTGKEKYLMTAYMKADQKVSAEVDKAFSWSDKLW